MYSFLGILLAVVLSGLLVALVLFALPYIEPWAERYFAWWERKSKERDRKRMRRVWETITYKGWEDE